MKVLWPQFLWLLLVLPLLPAVYLWLLRRRRVQVLRLSSLAVARRAHVPAWRRHLPPALVFAALALLLLALARPTAGLTLPWARSTVLLAIDISRSMRVDDVKPTRMVAAQEAAKAFVRELPGHIDVGLVTFAGSAQVAQPPTFERSSVLGAIDAIQMQLGTAIGSAIVLCLAELFPEQGIELGDIEFGGRARPRSLGDKSRARAPPAEPVAPGSFAAGAVILLSDGRRTTGVDTLQAARMAADRGVRVHVVGLGTPDGHLAMGAEMAIYLQLDEPTLREVARMTGGDYHAAASAEELRSVYRQLGTRLQVGTRDTELTAGLCALAAAALVAAAGLSLHWFGRVA